MIVAVVTRKVFTRQLPRRGLKALRGYCEAVCSAPEVRVAYPGDMKFDAGDAMPFDWSHEVVSVGGVDTKVYVAHFRLCHSRKPFVVAYYRASQEMALDAFSRALNHYVGVPRRVIIDNPRTMVVFIGKLMRSSAKFWGLSPQVRS